MRPTNHLALALILLTITLLLLVAYSKTLFLSLVAPPLSIRSPVAADDDRAFDIVIWTVRFSEDLGGPNLILWAAEAVKDLRIRVNLQEFSEWAELEERFSTAAAIGQGPDIVAVSGLHRLRPWADAGYIAPFGPCRARYAEFNDIMEDLWNSTSWAGQVWGVPTLWGAGLLYFNKARLRELGWSEVKIAALPRKIERGEFTLEDMIATSHLAIEQGVIESGFGYWYRPARSIYFLQLYVAYGGRFYDPARDKLVIVRQALVDWYTFQYRLVTEHITPEGLLGNEWNTGVVGRSIYHDTVSHGRILFWLGGSYYWPIWTKEYVADLGGQEYLNRFVGYAPLPAGFRGQPGNTYARVRFYAITTEKASSRWRQDAACALLSKMVSPALNTPTVLEQMALSPLQSSLADPAYLRYPVLAETTSMLAYSWYRPPLPLMFSYENVLWDFMLKAENGEMSPVEAVSAAIETLQHEFGDDLIVE